MTVEELSLQNNFLSKVSLVNTAKLDSGDCALGHSDVDRQTGQLTVKQMSQKETLKIKFNIS